MKKSYLLITLLALGVMLGVGGSAVAQDVLSITIVKPDSGKVLGIDSLLQVEIVASVPTSLNPVLEAWLYDASFSSGASFTSPIAGLPDSTATGFTAVWSGSATSGDALRRTKRAASATAGVPLAGVGFSAMPSSRAVVGVSVQAYSSGTTITARTAPYTIKRAVGGSAAATAAGTLYGNDDSVVNELDSLAATDDGDSIVVSEVTVGGATRTKFTWFYRVRGGVGEYAGSFGVAAQIKGTVGVGTGAIGGGTANAAGNFKRSKDTATSSFTGTNKLFGVDGVRPTNPNSGVSGFGVEFATLTSATSYGTTATSVHLQGTGTPHMTAGTGGTSAGDTIKIGDAQGGSPTFSDGTNTRKVLGVGDTLTIMYPITATQASGGIFSTATFSKLVGKAKIKGGLVSASYVGTPNRLKAQQVLTATDGYNFPSAVAANKYADTLAIFLQDAAGNLSDVTEYSGIGRGVTQAVTFILDTTAPVLDAAGVSDTVLPTSNDTIADGSVDVGPDINPLQWKLSEVLDSLYIAFDGAYDGTITVRNNGGNGQPSIASNGLSAGARNRLAFHLRGTRGGTVAAASRELAVWDSAGTTKFNISSNTPVTWTNGATAADTLLRTGVHSIALTGVDLARNKGTVLTRSNVYVDVDDINLLRLFPTNSGLDTLEEATAPVIFKLSEPADSVLISYTPLANQVDTVTRTRRLVSSQLTQTTSEQTFAIDSLRSGSRYILTVLARDLAGNFTRSAPDTFLYDTSFVVPVIAKFTITSSPAVGLGSHVIAGSTVALTVNAKTSKDAAAVTYKKAAILKVTSARTGAPATGLALLTDAGLNTGITKLGDGRFQLNDVDWITGTRTVSLKDTTSIDTMRVQVIDSSIVASVYQGVLDSSIVVDPQVYSKLVASAPTTAVQGTQFWVGLTAADVYNNKRSLDDRLYSVSANKLGVVAPTEVYLTNGAGGFWAKSESFAGTGLKFTVRDLVANSGADGIPAASTDVGDNFVVVVTDSVTVSGTATATLDAPDTLAAADYMGADNAGDQGGFVLLTFPKSADHSTLTAYRIWREIQVTKGLNATTGGISTLAAPVAEFVPWGKVDAVPGVTGAMQVVVATLDNVSTRWAISAERGAQTTRAKEAFAGAAAVRTPYELMAKTMLKSKQAASNVNAPVFATLTPEALAFSEKGVVPRLSEADASVAQSARIYTATAVRSVDNIAPEAVTYLRALDTQNDVGGSITVTWAKSESDRMLPRSVANAVGPSIADLVPGVKGYNVYRKVGTGEYLQVGKAATGETAFVDATVFNGVRYTYTVKPYDSDNETSSAIEKSVMPVRNRATDKSGRVVLGLFGADNEVGFDDFFAFADNFGVTAADEAFDPAFDLSVDNKIDFSDFFVFADNFGRAIEAAGKVVPMMAGLNSDARLTLTAAGDLPRVGQETAVNVDLANFVELKGYGFSVSYDPAVLEFVKVTSESSLLGSEPLAQPLVVADGDGKVSVAAYGKATNKGDLGVSLVFRTKTEIDNSYIEVTKGELRDGNYGLNQVASLGSVAVQTRPEVYGLNDNYPNPFNPETTIRYQLPDASDVRLEIYNVVGQVVRTLVAERQSAGRYVVQWDAANDSNQPLSSGIYFYRLQAGDFQKIKKMLLLK